MLKWRKMQITPKFQCLQACITANHRGVYKTCLHAWTWYDEAYEENNQFPHKTTEVRKPFARCQGCKVPNTKHITALSMSYVPVTNTIWTKKQNYDYNNQIMQVIYCWAFAVAPALCPPCHSTLKSGGTCAPPEYIAPAPMSVASVSIN